MTIDEIITLLNIDTLTLAVSGVLVLLAACAALVSPFFRAVRPKAGADLSDDSGLSERSASPSPSLSVLLTPHDNALQLKRHLDAYLGQDYPDFRVIVVTWKGDHESDDILKSYGDNPRLYTTYIPDSSRYMPREKLAVTLGVKAAQTEWVVMADIACEPDSDQWLKALTRKMTEHKTLVVAHTRYSEDTSTFRRFERLYKELYLLHAVQSGQTYRADGGCVAFRKSEFMKGEGYRGNLKYLRGEFDFLVNKYARPGNVAVALDREAWMTEEEPTDKRWHAQHLFYMETRQHLDRSSSVRCRYNLHQWALHLPLVVTLAAGVVAALTAHWLLLGVAIVSLLVAYGVRTHSANKTMDAWDEEHSAAALYFYELRLVWLAMGLFHKYRKSNKNDFISHKL